MALVLMFGRQTFKERFYVEETADCNNYSQNCENSTARKEKKRPELNPKIHFPLPFIFVGKQQRTDYHRRRCQKYHSESDGRTRNINS